MQVDAYAAGAPGGGPVLQALAGSPRCRRGSPRCGQPGSRGWFINGWVWNGRCGAAGLPRLVRKRMGMEWPAAAGVVDDRGYCGRGPAQVSASGVDTVAFRSFGEVVVL